MATTTTTLGKVMPVLKGEYNAAVTYGILDVVTYQGNHYISRVNNNLNHAVSDQSWWLLISNEGDRQSAEGLRTTAETTRQSAEGLRVTAETTRQGNETGRQTAEGLRVTAETARHTAEGLRVTAEQTRQTNTGTAIQNANTATGLANDAAALANTKAGLANDAATLANEKAELANDAATAANDAAEAVAPSVINNEEVQAEVYNMLNARITALEAIIAAGVYSYIQADTLIGVNSLQYKGAELILTGTAAPAVAPDFVGQVFVNTTGGVTYMAKGIASAADWKQTSN